VLRWLLERLAGLPSTRSTCHELNDPFRAEVLHDGVAVATLSDRVITDMFWRRYRIEPIGDAKAIYDDELWNRCRFAFRDPESGQVCTSGFVGGKAPFVREGRVHLRALSFDNARSGG
jgi:hypothetical protein